MIRQRHREVAGQLVDQLEGFPDTPVLEGRSSSGKNTDWPAGARPDPQPEEFKIRSQGGWHEDASRVDRMFRDVDLFSRLDDPAIAMLRSQGGPGPGLAVST